MPYPRIAVGCELGSGTKLAALSDAAVAKYSRRVLGYIADNVNKPGAAVAANTARVIRGGSNAMLPGVVSQYGAAARNLIRQRERVISAVGKTDNRVMSPLSMSRLSRLKEVANNTKARADDMHRDVQAAIQFRISRPKFNQNAVGEYAVNFRKP